MKKFIMRSSFALVMCCLLFAACSKDDNTDVNTASVTGYWVCYYQCWSEDGETWESNYNGDDYYINFSSHLADGKYEGGSRVGILKNHHSGIELPAYI